jgi:hypothetical protein
MRYKEHIQAIKRDKQNSKYAQHILDMGHTYSTMDQILEILHKEKKGQSLNTLERAHICNLGKHRLQTNDTFTDTHNPIFDQIIKTYPL